MQRCPTCGSRKWHGFKGRWKCGRCGKIWISSAIQEANNDRVIDNLVNLDKPSLIPQYNEELVDLHNIAIKFHIIKDSKVDWPIQEGFRGGGIQETTFKNHKVKKTKNWLIIYNDKRNKVPLKDLDKTYSLIIEGLVSFAKEISSQYGFEIDPIPLNFSSNRPEVKTAFTSSINFIEKEDKSVYAKSYQPGHIETFGDNSIPNAINLTEALAQLNSTLIIVNQELRVHSEVERRANEFLEKANERMTPPKENPLLNPLESLLSSAIKIKEAFDV